MNGRDSFWPTVQLLRRVSAKQILRSAQNDINRVVILNPSAVLRINSVRICFKLSHHPMSLWLDTNPGSKYELL